VREHPENGRAADVPDLCRKLALRDTGSRTVPHETGSTQNRDIREPQDFRRRLGGTMVGATGMHESMEVFETRHHRICDTPERGWHCVGR